MRHLKRIILIINIIMISFITASTANAQTITTPEGILFDAEYYAMKNPEIAEAYGNTFEGLYRHYLEHGKEEGRATCAANEVHETTSNTMFFNENAKNIFVGDSRVYVMHDFIGNDTASWIGFPGTRYDTLEKVVTPYIDTLPLAGKNIIIMYGINDITTYGSASTFNLYNLFLNNKAQEWINKGAKVYFANLAGIDNQMVEGGYLPSANEVAVINNEVAAFNKMMKQFPSNIRRINIKYGKNPFYDGIHFNEATCKSIYAQVNANCK